MSDRLLEQNSAGLTARGLREIVRSAPAGGASVAPQYAPAPQPNREYVFVGPAHGLEHQANTERSHATVTAEPLCYSTVKCILAMRKTAQIMRTIANKQAELPSVSSSKSTYYALNQGATQNICRS